MASSAPASKIQTLRLGFEGGFVCRIAVDPDPTDETRGLSGYTMALSREDGLDQVIQLQPGDEFYAKNIRPPLVNPAYWQGPVLDWPLGVVIDSVTVDGVPSAGASGVFHGQPVDLLENNGMFSGPIFSSYNNIIGSDNTMSFVIDPFDLRIGTSENVLLHAKDDIDPQHPERKLWEMSNPAIYQRRLTSATDFASAEALRAIGVNNPTGYMRDRVRYLRALIDAAQTKLATEQDESQCESLRADIQGYESRIYQIEFWGSRVSSKLETQVSWDFRINGRQEALADGSALGGRILTERPWRFQIWFGSWDGDLLIGFARGSLELPFVAEPH